ncbi:hypothetical protein COK59_04710 [Bacillus thuringiensis]|uniref:ImmA/IrrE family metallo-endopeptidase n=1 Tax=Bacillus thuringiensis TaxID=1428 RepID=UPI000BF7EDC3|nr:ImmA/IrrE family metallo-endopeptidase [Bacillus thuringiensis]MED3311231.1 ImmA/IrrE family metallo-endopeptidase [Bacillus thuringiensis]PFT11038.1 hypothetical protein COK59_04710 [Bacillus thuringiensis]PFU54584.1 hypothetical protein COK85_24575 [Bacillus thuringiensis]
MGKKKSKGNKKKELVPKNSDVLEMDDLIVEFNKKSLERLKDGKIAFFINGYSQIPGDSDNADDSGFFRGFCNEDEIKRLREPQNGEDYLLRLRAEAVVDNTRILRVISKRSKKNENWNFTNHFSVREFNYCLDRLTEEDKNKLKKVPMGFVFSDDPNGACMKTKFGNIIVVSETLRYFLFFMNLFMLNFDEEVPIDVMEAALTIAIRTMLGAEALDFDLDPRGIIPEEIQYKIDLVVENQLRFVIAHEFSHHILGHLDGKSVVNRELYKIFDDKKGNNTYEFYNNRQQQELEADEAAIMRLNFKNQWEFESLVHDAILFFVYLDIYDSVCNKINSQEHLEKTHPNPLDRMWNIYEVIKDRVSFDKSIIENALRIAGIVKGYLKRDLDTNNTEKYRSYGSVYLGKWRGPVLIDRIDY